MSNKFVVRFLKAWRGYSADELAGFDEEVVEGLKAKGFAEVYEKPKGGKAATAKNSSAKPADGAGGASETAEPPSAATNRAEGGDGNTGADDDAKP